MYNAVLQLRVLKTGKRPKAWDDDSLTKALGMRASMSVKLYNYLRRSMRWAFFNDKIGITVCSYSRYNSYGSLILYTARQASLLLF